MPDFLTLKFNTMWIVGLISDQVQNNHAAWVTNGKSFEDYDSACEYAYELQESLPEEYSGESIYFQEEED
jgi:hypothetical protein